MQKSSLIELRARVEFSKYTAWNEWLKIYKVQNKPMKTHTIRFPTKELSH